MSDSAVWRVEFIQRNWAPLGLLDLSSQLWHKSRGYGRTLYIDYEAWVRSISCTFCSIVLYRLYYLPALSEKSNNDEETSTWKAIMTMKRTIKPKIRLRHGRPKWYCDMMPRIMFFRKYLLLLTAQIARVRSKQIEHENKLLFTAIIINITVCGLRPKLSIVIISFKITTHLTILTIRAIF